MLTLLAGATLLVAPLVPGALSRESPQEFLGIPVESVIIVLLLLIVVRAPLQVLAAAVFGAVVLAAVLVSSLDLAFRETIDRPFNAAEDGGALVDAFGVVQNALGAVGATTVLAGVGALVVAFGAVVALAALRVGRRLSQRRRGRAAVAVVATVWIVCSLVDAQLVSGAPVAASRTGDTLVASSARVVASMQEQRAFERALTSSDPLDDMPRARLLTGLAGKDVVVAFVESYGRVAVQPSPFTDGIARTLDEGETTLTRHGFAARSAFLSSPTFGGVSWLAHATLQSGVWVDSPRKYDRLLSQDRTTLTSVFERAGWRTMAVVPSNERGWEAGESFYGFDTILDARSMGYRGPAFGYARMPDQYTWKVFHDHASDNGSGPLMTEIDFVSSHTPWTPLPRMVSWSDLGDGSVFAPQAAGESALAAWSDPERVRALYAESVEYSLAAMFSYLETFGHDDLVLIVLGDHQPARIVSGPRADHDVPITIIAKDGAIFESIQAWGWEEGVRPSEVAPVWRMDEFRDRFVDAFSG
ncbi:CDP-alcohol phosphatidyltransferase [Microbacterium allomyrinae]|uniref:CDP-alcohol phosphatidyltransferase n=1 Tax=Microbacterium allomyrinae TaxID=2830666 RepID=A0A9X1S0Y2_9MICO|nr:CDP-alcohol phosphatidyltransferase [Microbacterium allomyrinae]MCC2031076.1 CDP-alcohol phosphatidyltransferase [Microbacterium allomyrinae]